MTAPKQPSGPPRFASLDELRAAHATLLQYREQFASEPALLDAAAQFVVRGSNTGALLYDAADRQVAQSLLTYWSNLLYRAGREPPEALLALFDEQLAPLLPDTLCPYIGLEPFGENDKDRFFGRKTMVENLLQHLGEHRLLAVVGPSGSGKSSLVRAGLLPVLRAGGLPGSADWRYLPPIVPGSSPLARLAQLFRPSKADSAAWEQRLVPEFMRDEGYLTSLLNRLPPKPTVLVIDQFEELFTLVEDRRELRAFANNLAHFAAAPGPRHILILTMREEFVQGIAEVPALAGLFRAGRQQVDILLSDELRETIVQPAKQIGLIVDREVVERLVDDLAGDPAVLPLLQFTLRQLWLHRRRNRITAEVYRQVGENGKALEMAADAFLSSQSLEQNRDTIKRILLRLVEVRHVGEVTNKRVRRATLYSIPHDPGRIDRMLAALVSAGLVRLTHGNTPDDDQVELAHEALIRNWKTLRDWLEEERGRLSERQSLASAAEQWRLRHRDPGALWVSRDLLDTTSSYGDLSPLEHEFVEASAAAIAEKEAADQRELEQARALAEERAQTTWRLQRQQRLLVITTLVAVVAAVVALQLYFLAERRRTQAEQAAAQAEQARQQAAAQALVLKMQSFRSDRDLFLRTAIWLAEQDQAANTASGRSGEASQLAYQDLLQQALQTRLPGIAHSGLSAAAWSPDGQQLATLGNDRTTGRTVRFWNTENVWEPRAAQAGALITTTQPLTSTQLLWSRANPQRLLTADSDGRARLLDRATGAELQVFTHDTSGHNPLGLIAWSRDEQLLLTAGVENVRNAEGQPPRDQVTVKLWAVGNNTIPSMEDGPRCTLNEYRAPITALAWAPSAHMLLIASQEQVELRWADTGCTRAQMRTFDAPVRAASWSPDGKWLALAVNRQVQIWDIQTDVLGSQPAALLVGHTGLLSSLAWSTDSHRLLTVGDDNIVRVWEIGLQQYSGPSAPAPALAVRQLSELRGQWQRLISAAWQPYGGALLVAGTEPRDSAIAGDTDEQVRLYTLDDFQKVLRVAHEQLPKGSAQTLLKPEEQQLMEAMAQEVQQPEVAVAPTEGQTEAAATQLIETLAPTAARPTSTATRSPTALPSPTETPVLATEPAQPATDTLVPTSTNIATDTPEPPTPEFGTITPLELPSIIATTLPTAVPTELPPTPSATPAPTQAGGATVLSGHTDYVLEARFSPNGDLIASASKDGTARVWRTSDGTLLHVLRHTNRVNSVAFSPDGATVVTSSDDQRGRLWDAQTGQPIAELPHNERVNNAEFSPDGTWVVTASRDNTAKVWDASTGAPLCTLQHNRQVFTALFNQNSDRVVTAVGDGTVQIWRISASGCDTQPERTLSGHTDSVLSARFSPEGQRVISASTDGTARIWNVQTGQSIELKGHTGWVRRPSFSPDGTLALTASDDGTARIWRASDGALVASLPHGGEVLGAMFSPDNRTIATSSADKTVRLWDAQTGQLLRTFSGHTDPVISVEFDNDGERLVSASLDGTVRVWPLSDAAAPGR